MNANARWTVVGAGVALVAVFVVVSRISGLNEKIGLFLALVAAAFLAYVGALVALRRGAPRGVLIYAFVVAAICRAVLIPAEPVMSTDVYRYLWEGRAITHGKNPFAHSPDADELESLRDEYPEEYYEGINHKHLETIYPPASQGVFALAAWLRPDPQTQKFFFMLFDLGTVLLLGAFLRTRSLDPAAAIVYAWNPLVIFETGHSGHVEPVGIFFLILGLWLIARERKAWGFAAMGVSILAKYLAAVFVPYFLVRRKYAAWLGVMASVAVVGYLPFISAGEGLFSSLDIYASVWRFNGLVYKLSYSVLGDSQWTRRILTLALGVVVVYQALKQKDAVRFGFVVVATGLLLAPTLYPWYVAWIVPFLCFYRNRAWLLLTGLVMASYWVWEIYAGGGEWEVPWWLYALEYTPFYALLLFDAVRGRRRAREAVSA